MNARGPRLYYTCRGCGLETEDAEEIVRHTTYEEWNMGNPCWGAGCQWWIEEVYNAGTYEDPVWEYRWVDGPSTIIRICTLCGETERAEGHVHLYATSGHVEQGQIGTRAVEKYGQVAIYGCRGEDYLTINHADVNRHTGGPDGARVIDTKLYPHFGVGTWWTIETKAIGMQEEPRYGKKWVADASPACSVCGQQIPG